MKIIQQSAKGMYCEIYILIRFRIIFKHINMSSNNNFILCYFQYTLLRIIFQSLEPPNIPSGSIKPGLDEILSILEIIKSYFNSRR